MNKAESSDLTFTFPTKNKHNFSHKRAPSHPELIAAYSQGECFGARESASCQLESIRCIKVNSNLGRRHWVVSQRIFPTALEKWGEGRRIKHTTPHVRNSPHVITRLPKATAGTLAGDDCSIFRSPDEWGGGERRGREQGLVGPRKDKRGSFAAPWGTEVSWRWRLGSWSLSVWDTVSPSVGKDCTASWPSWQGADILGADIPAILSPSG